MSTRPDGMSQSTVNHMTTEHRTQTPQDRDEEKHRVLAATFPGWNVWRSGAMWLATHPARTTSLQQSKGWARTVAVDSAEELRELLAAQEKLRGAVTP